ncbi:MAG: hypothetical protein C4560_08220 [Nitrospiraceae bacterium]|nr:MAG: hypothetical protein C4560_08220 [Nitrospiraceae bacterium]
MAFACIFIYMFFFFIRPQDWWGPLLGVPVDNIIIPFIIISNLFLFPKFIKLLKMPQSKFILLFVGAVFLSNFVNGNTDAAFEYGIKYLKFTIIFFAIALSISSVPKLKWFVPYLLLLITFIAYQGIIMSETGTNWAGQSLYWANRVRWVGVFDGANITALAFISAIPFLMEYLLGPWNAAYRIFAGILGYFILQCFYLTNSRGGFISLLAVIFSFFAGRVKNKKGIIAGLIFAIILLTVAAPSRMSEIDDSTHSTRGRINAWSEALDMVRYDNPLFGIGKGQFTKYSSIIAHNAFLQQLGETGLVGAFFWVGLLYTSIKGMLIVIRKEDIEPVNRSLYRGYFTGVIGLLAGAVFISADHELLYIWLAFLTSIILIEDIDLKFSLRDMKIIGLIEIGYIFFTYCAVNIFRIIY